MSGRPWRLLLLVVLSTTCVTGGCFSAVDPPGPTAPASTASAGAIPTTRTAPTPRASRAELQFPGHLPGARALSTYTRDSARSAAWTSKATTDHWLLRSACTSRQPGSTLHYEVSRATTGPVDEEEQLSVGSGDVVCDGAPHDMDLGKIQAGRLAVEVAVDDDTLRAYAIVVPGPA